MNRKTIPLTLAALIALTTLPALADDTKEQSMTCTMVLSAQTGKPVAHMTTFNVTPVSDGVLYNWMTSAGTVTAGQGTASVLIEHAPQGGEMVVTVDALDRDACPKESNHATITVTVPARPTQP